MTGKTRLAAALALGAGLMAAGVAAAQSQTGSAAPPAASARPAPPPAQSTPPVQSDTSTIQHQDPIAGQPTYSASPPPDSAPGIYLPSVILGYARSATACAVVGCDDGPQVHGYEPSSSGANDPLPVTPGPYTPH
ncbi:MAG TPA: hypothetical protein VGH03_14480 [Caulobacteraceae bacterium]|jgi:hypothetical protein